MRGGCPGGEEAALKAVGLKRFAGSNPVPSVSNIFTSIQWYWTMKKIIKLSLATLFPIITLSCNSVQTNLKSESTTKISNKNPGISFKFLKPEQISKEVITSTVTEAQKLADKASKARDIDFFNLPQNPVGLELKNHEDSAYILNYIGTSKNTPDLSIEMRAFFTPDGNIFSFNYSGPVTLSGKKNFMPEKSFLKSKNKGSGPSFELITGLPQEYIVNAYENYLERNIKDVIKQLYRPQNIKFDSENVFIYAVHNGAQLDSFFFESHHNFIILGERKYADLQIGIAISTEAEIKSNYMIVGFNPKTPLNTQPEYEYKKIDGVNVVQLGEL